MKSSIKKPNFKVKHPYGYLIKSMLVGFILVFSSILSFGTGLIDLKPKAQASADTTISSYYSGLSSSSKKFAGGNGSSTDPFLISSVAEWAHFQWHVANYNGGYGYYYALAGDIDFSGYIYNTHIGAATLTAPTSTKQTTGTGKSFAGVLWGEGHRLLNIITHDGNGGEWIGGVFNTICGYSAPTTTINATGSSTPVGVYDLIITDFNGEGLGQDVGSGILADQIRYARIANVFCYTTQGLSIGVSAGARFGGVIGTMAGSQLWACQSEGYTIYSVNLAGGIVAEALTGYGNNYISNCRNMSKIVVGASGTSTEGWSAGGILGGGTFASGAETVIQNCVNLGEVTTQPYGTSTTNGSSYYANTQKSIHGIAGGANSTSICSTTVQNTYLDIFRCYNDAPVRVQTYTSGSITTVNATYGIAHTFYGYSSHKNFYNSSYNSSGAASTSYVSALTSFVNNTTLDTAIYAYQTAHTMVHSGNMFSMKGGFPSTSYSTSYSSSINRYSDSTAPASTNFTTTGKIVRVNNYGSAEYGECGITYQIAPYGSRSTSGWASYYLFDQYGDSDPIENGYPVCVTIPAGYSLSMDINTYTKKGSSYTSQEFQGSLDRDTIINYYIPADNILDYSIGLNPVRLLRGSGTINDPYKITSYDDMMAIYKLDDENVYFAFQNDITITAAKVQSTLFTETTEFKGVLLGNGYTLTFDNQGLPYTTGRLFGAIADTGKVYDLNIYYPQAYDSTNMPAVNAINYPSIGGFVCEENYGIIDSVRVYIDGATFVDGSNIFASTPNTSLSLLASFNRSSGVISNCLVTGANGDSPTEITINISQDAVDDGVPFNYCYGAMTAINEGSVIGCVANTNITVGSQYATSLKGGVGSSLYAGGLVGYDDRDGSNTEVSNNYFQGVFSGGLYGEDLARTAGIIGWYHVTTQTYADTVNHNIARATGTTDWNNQIICDAGPRDNWPNNYYIGNAINENGAVFFPYVANAITAGSSIESVFGDEEWDSRYWMPSRASGLGNFVPGYNMWAPRNFKTYQVCCGYSGDGTWTGSADNDTWCNDMFYDSGAWTVSGSTITVSSGIGLAAVMTAINQGITDSFDPSDITTIALAGNIDLSGKYWIPIKSCNVTEFDGNGYTIYGLESMGFSFYDDGNHRLGGLFNATTMMYFHDVVFENCMIHDAFNLATAGFATNNEQGGTYSNITFKNCVIYQDPIIDFTLEDHNANSQGLVVGLADRTTISNITITGSDITTITSKVVVKPLAHSNVTSYLSNVGGVVGYAGRDGVAVTDVVINGFDFIMDTNGTDVQYVIDTIYTGYYGVVAGYVENLECTRVDVMQTSFSLLGSHADHSFGFGYAGFVFDTFNLYDSIVNLDINIDPFGQQTEEMIGGIVGNNYGTTTINGCDINVTINQSVDSLNNQFYYVQGIAGYTDGLLEIYDSIYRFSGNPNNTGVLCYNDGGEVYLERNIIALDRGGSTTASHYNAGSVSSSDNVVYGYGNTTTSNLFNGTAKAMFNDDDMYSLLKPFNDMGIGNSFYANKYTAYGNSYLGANLAYRGAELYGSGDNLTPLSTSDNSAYFHVYNTISPGYAAKLVYYNTAGASDSTVIVHRHGYNISSLSASAQYGQTPNIWYAVGDDFEFYLNNTSYSYSAELQELNEVDEAVERTTTIANSGYSTDTTHTITNTDVSYANSCTPILLVSPAVSVRYFAIHKNMTISSGTATKVATRGNYYVYSATPNTSISVRISGNTLGYSTSSTSYYTGLKKGSINTSGTYTNSGSLTASSSSLSASGHYTYTFTVNDTYSSASSTGNVITYTYNTGTLYKQTITYSADKDGAGNSMTAPGSSKLYFTTSLTGTTKYTSLYVKTGTTITATYPSTSGEWTRTGTALNSGSLTSNTSTSAKYTSTTAARTLTVTYACNTYEVEVWIFQEAAQYDLDYQFSSDQYPYLPIVSSAELEIDNASELWGSLPADMQVTAGSSTVAYSTATNGLYNHLYRSAYITYGGKNYIGSISVATAEGSMNYRSYITAVKYNTSLTVAAVCPSMYVLSGATYTYANASTTFGNGTATTSGNNITFKVLGTTNLMVDFKQDDWDSDDNYAAASLSSGSYVINSAAKFGWMVAKINESATYAGYSYSITADIDLAGKYISPITREFTGTINGNQYTIKNLTSWKYEMKGFINTNSGTIQNLYFGDMALIDTFQSFIGLVYQNSDTGLIKNVGLFTDNSQRYCLYRSPVSGGVAFVYNNAGTIDSCFDAQAYRVFWGPFGGLAINNGSIISNCYTLVKVEPASTVASVGWPSVYTILYNNQAQGEIYNCYSRVTTPMNTNGAISLNDNEVTNVYTDRNEGDMNGAVYKTAAEMATASTFAGWDGFAQKWVMKSGSGTYKNQTITGYPLLNMGDTSDLIEVHFRATIRQDGGTTENVEVSNAYGWEMSTDVVYAASGVPFTFTLSAANILSVSPFFEKAVTSEGFSTAITGNATNKYGNNTFTWTPSFTSGATEAYITLHFYYPTITMTGDYALSTGALSARASGAFTAANSDNTVGYSWSYGLDTAKKAIRVQTIKVCGVDVLTSGSTTAITRYIYKSGSTYSANTSDSGTGSKVCKVVITPSSATAGTIEISHQKEDVTISTVAYINLSVSYSGLASGTTNTITTYQKLGSSGSASAIKTVRSSGATTASSTVSVGWYPIISGSTYYYYGNILGGNTTGYTYYQAGYNGSKSVVNANYASTDNYTHYVSANDLAGASSTPATLDYTYGPGKFTYTISIKSVSYLTTKPTKITITPSGTGISDTAKSFSSVAANQTVTFEVMSGNTPKFTASCTAASGKVYRFIWGSTLSSGTANAQLTASSATQARTYYVSPIERYNFTATASLNMTNGGRTYATTYSGKYPQVSITYAKNSNLAGSTGTTVSNSTTSASISTGQVVDHGSAVSFAQSLNRTVDSTNSVTLAHVYTFGSWTNGSAITSATANVSATANYSVIVRTITTRITNKDLTIHPDAYIGIASNAGDYTFSDSTLHTTNSSGHYYVYYAGLTASTGTGDSVTRGYRTFYVTGGEFIIAERWDLKASNYINLIASITHTSSSNTATEVFSSSASGVLIGLSTYVKANDDFKFTYYPLVEVNLARTATTTSVYATNNKDTLLPITATRADSANIKVKGTKTSGTNPPYAYSTIDDTDNLFEPIVYMQLSYTVPTANLTGWNFNGWYISSSAIGTSGSKTVNSIVYTIASSTSGTNTIYTLTFTIPAQSTEEGNSINTFQYYIKFTEKTYTFTTYTNLTSGGSTAENNSAASRSLFEYTTSSYTDSTKKAVTLTANGTKHTATIAYYGYYLTQQDSTDTNNYAYASGITINNCTTTAVTVSGIDAAIKFTKPTAAVTAYATYKKWHTISAPTIKIDYSTSGYTDNQYNVTNSGYVYTFNARTSSSTANVAQIGTITLSGITDKDGTMKVLEGATLTITVTTNTNKFRITSTPASKTITADSTVTAEYAENVLSIKFYKNTASTTQVGSTVSLGTLNAAYTIASTYRATAGTEYVFSHWTASGSLEFGSTTTLATTIKKESVNGSNGAIINVYANWRRTYYMTWATATVSTTHTTSGKTCAGGSVSVTPGGTAVSSKYSKDSTATVSNSIVTGHRFVAYNPSNATISGTTATRTFTKLTASSNQVTYSGSTLYVSGSYLYTNAAHTIMYSAYDYDISGTTVKIYDKAAATIGATFAELTYELTMVQPAGGTIIIQSTTSTAVLPSGYTLLEYIESTGTQYINTGYFWQNENVRVILDGMVTKAGSSRSMFGNEEHVVSTASGGRYFSIIPHGSQTSSAIYAGSTNQGSLSTTLNTRFLMDIYTTTSKTIYASMNGVSKISAKSYSGSVITNPNKLTNGVGQIYIFANHNSGTGAVLSGATPIMAGSQIMAGMRVYSFKMFDNNALVRSFVPAKNSSGTVGLYDLVGQKFYTDAAGGSFTAGANATASNTTAVLGYFSTATLKYTNTDPYYRFKGWNIDTTAFSNTPEPSDATVTLGPNVLKSSTVSVNEAVQRKISPSLWQIRYLTSSTASYPNDTPIDIYLNGANVVWKYTNAIMYYTATDGAMTTTNWSYTCTADSSHKGSSLASRTTTCATCGSSAKVTGVDMYVELTGDGLYLNTSTGKLYTDSGYKSELSASYTIKASENKVTIAGKDYPIVNNRVSYGGATVTIGMVLTSNTTYTVPESASAVFYKFTVGNTNSNTWSMPFSDLGLGHNGTGSATGENTITFLANGATLPNQSNAYSIGIRPYDDIEVEDDTSSNNSHVYITSANNPSIKVLEGSNVTIIATDYAAATGDNKAYKFSHWTFTPADSGYSSNANWMETEGLKYTKNPTFAVYANREGTYTAHYVYAYKMTTAQAYTTDGTSFTNATVATLTTTDPTYADDTYAKGSTITLTPDFSKTNYTFYGWYLLSGTTYTKITNSTTGCSLNGNVLTITVGGATCDNATVTGGLDLSKYTIVLAGQEVLSYTIGSFSEVGPTATYTATGAGIISATDGDGNAITVSNNKVSASLAPGKVMTVKVKAGTSLTLSSTHTAGTHRATGMTFNENDIAATDVTLANSGLTGVSLKNALTTTSSNDGHYRVVYTPVWTVAPTLAVSATHVTTGKTASFTGSSYITLSASGGYTYDSVKYYDDGTVLTLSKTLPTGYAFTSWTIAPTPTYSSGSATSESPKILLKAKLTTVTLNIKELEYTVSANTVVVNIPASSINNITDATTWSDTASSFGTITYTTNHTDGAGKVGYFGTLSAIKFTPSKYLYVNNSKLYYDANNTHPVYANLYKANSSTSFTYLGTTYTASSNKITINNNLYAFTTFAKSGGGTLASATTNGSAKVNPNITSNVTISASVNMYVYYNQSSYNLATASSTVSGATTKSNTAATLGSSVTLTAATVSGYVFKGWKYSSYSSGTLTAYNSGAIVSTSTSYTFTATEALNGVVCYAVYAPLYSITLDASTFSQGSITYQYKTPSADNYTTAATITAKKTLTGIEYNTIFKLTATPSGQNRFNFWSTANSTVTTSTASYEYHLLATDTVTANFLTQYTITINHAVAAGGTYTVQEYNCTNTKEDIWAWENCENLVNVSGNKTLTTADSGKDYRVVVTTKANYRVAVTGTATVAITGTNNANNTSGTKTTTATYTALNGAKTVTITHTPLTYVAVSTAPGGLGNTISIAQNGSAILASKSGTESITSTTFEGGKSMTITTSAVDGYGTPKFYNGTTLLAEGTTYTFTPSTGSTYNISVKYTSTDITIDTVGYFGNFRYASKTGDTVGNYSIVYNDGTSSIALTSGATGIRFNNLFGSTLHTSVSLYAGSTLVKTITSDTYIDYTLPVGSETPTLKLVFTNKTWLDTGYYTTPGGSGTPESPYIIDSAGDFAWISYQSLVNSNNFAGKYFSLTASIDLSSRLWVPIQNFNGVIISTNLDNTIYCNQIIVSDSLQITGLGEKSTSTYGGLVAESNGGVFRNITLHGTDAYGFTTIGNTYTHVALLCGKGTDVVIDNIYADYISLDYSEDIKLAYIIAELNGGKISNIAYGDTEMMGSSGSSSEVHTSGAGSKTYYYWNDYDGNFVEQNTDIYNINVSRTISEGPAESSTSDEYVTLSEGATIEDFETALYKLENDANTKYLYVLGTLDFGGAQLSRQYSLPAGKTVAGIDGIISNISAHIPFGNTGAIWTSIQGTLKNIIFQNIRVTAYTTSTLVSEASMGILAGEVSGATIHNVSVMLWSFDFETSGSKIATHINIGGLFGKITNSNLTYVATTVLGQTGYGLTTYLKVSHFSAPVNTFNANNDCNAINIGVLAGYFSNTSSYQMKAISLVFNSIVIGTDGTEKAGMMFGYANGSINNSYVQTLFGVYTEQSLSGIGTFAAYGTLTADKLYAANFYYGLSDDNADSSVKLPNLYTANNQGTFTNTYVHKGISTNSSAKTSAQILDTSTYVGWNFASNNQSGTVMWCPAWAENGSYFPYINLEAGFTTVNIQISGEAASQIEMNISSPGASLNVLTMQGAGNWVYDAAVGTEVGARTYFGGHLPTGVYLDTTASTVTYGITGIIEDSQTMKNQYGIEDFYGPLDMSNYDLFAELGNLSGLYYSFNFVFKYSTHIVSTTADGHGTATGGGTYKFGDTVSLVATPTANETYVGHRFIGWYKNTSVFEYKSVSNSTKLGDRNYSFNGKAYYGSVYLNPSKFVPGTTYYVTHDVVSASLSTSRSTMVIYYTSDGDSATRDYIEVNSSTYSTGGKCSFSITPAAGRTISSVEFRFARLGNNTTQRTVEIDNLEVFTKSTTAVSTNATYSFTMNESTAGLYEARFCDGNTRPCNYKATASSTGATVSVSPTGYVLQGTTMTITTTLSSGQEITKITRSSDSTDVYTKAGGAISGYTFTAPNILTFAINNTTKGAYTVTIGSTSHNVTINVPNVGDGTTTGDGDDYSAHEAITMKSGSTTLGTIAADGVTGIATVVYNNTLTISFMSALRYKLGSIVSTQSGTATTISSSSITVTTSTVSGYTRYTYSYTTSAVTGDFTLTIKMVKDRWVDFTSFSGTSFTAGHSAEFITANGGRVAYETAGSTTNYTFDKTSAKGIGTHSNPFKIATAAQLARVAYLININASYYYSANGTSYAAKTYRSACYVITADIDLGNYFWTPINMNQAGSTTFMLGGDISRTISNMNIRIDEEEYAINSNKVVTRDLGFIAQIAGGSIYNLTFSNANVYSNLHSTSSETAVVVGYGYYLNINNVQVIDSSVKGTYHVSGVVGSIPYASALNNIVVKNTTIGDSIPASTTTYLAGIAYSIANSSLTNISIENNVMSGTSPRGGGITYILTASSIKNAAISLSSSAASATYFGMIARAVYTGCEIDNVWVKALGSFKNTYVIYGGRTYTINTLANGKTIAQLGFDSDIWYINSSTNLPTIKLIGSSTNQINYFADVTSGTISGSGTKASPYLIDSANTLRYITYLINSNNSKYNASTVYYKLTADIDMGGGFSKIIAPESSVPFKAHIDGDFHTISNLYIYNSTASYSAFIGYSNAGHSVKNINFTNLKVINNVVYGSGYAAGIMAYTIAANIVNVNVDGVVTSANEYASGVVACTSTSSSLGATIQNVSFNGVVQSATDRAAGIISNIVLGNNVKEFVIDTVSVEGFIAGRTYVGGIIANVYGDSTYSDRVYVRNSYNNATLSAYSITGVGGIVGKALNTTVENCYNNGDIILVGATVASSSANYNTDSSWNNGTNSWDTTKAVFAGELIGRIYDGSVTYPTIISNSAFNAGKYIMAVTTSSYLIPLGGSTAGHTPNGYSIYSYTADNVTYSNEIPEGEGQMYSDSEMKTASPYTVWDEDTIWNIANGSYPVHRWNTQNRLYFEGEGLELWTDPMGGVHVLTENGMFTCVKGSNGAELVPLTDSDGRIYVYEPENTSIVVTLVPDANFSIASVESRAYYTSSFTSIMNGENTEYEFELGDYSDGTNFKVFKATFVNSKFTITVNTELVRGTGISIGEYETLHIVILNTTTNEAYTTSLDNGTYLFDDLKAGTYYIGVYTTMFFDVSDIDCTYDSSNVNFSEVDFYYTLVLSNSTSPNATIDITATKNVDAWIYSAIEIDK